MPDIKNFIIVGDSYGYMQFSSSVCCINQNPGFFLQIELILNQIENILSREILINFLFMVC
jgi:hypothetical protein